MEKIKTVVLNGSAKQTGATGAVLTWITEELSEYIDLKWINTFDLSVRPCIGCMQCRPDKGCALPKDDGHLIGELLKEADLLIVGSPSYWSGMPSPLKVLFDRNVSVLEYCLDKAPVPNMAGKKAIGVITCASPEPRSLDDDQLPLLEKSVAGILRNSGYEIVDILKISESWNWRSSEVKIRNAISGLRAGVCDS